MITPETMCTCCSFSLHDIATIISAYSRAGPVDRILLESMSSAVRLLPGDMIDPQTLALTANAFARARVNDPLLFAHLATAAVSIDVAVFDPQTIAFLLNAFARDSALMRNRPKPPAFLQALSRRRPPLRDGAGLELLGFNSLNNQSEVGRIKILEVLRSEAVIDSSTSEAGLLGRRAVDDVFGSGRWMEGSALSDQLQLASLRGGLQGTPPADLGISRAVSFPVIIATDGERTRRVDGSGMSDDELKALADYLSFESPRIKPGIIVFVSEAVLRLMGCGV